MAFTVTDTVPTVEVHPFSIATTSYVPDAATVAAAMLGSSCVDAQPLGPDHEYDAPGIVLAVKFRSLPAQMGLLLLATGAAGTTFTVTLVLATADVHPFSIATTL